MDPRAREEKELLLLALQEKRRRDKLKKPPFVPNEGQDKVIRSEATIRIVTSGNGSGKTALAVVEAANTAKGLCPITKRPYKVPNKVLYVLDRPGKVNDKIVPEFKLFFDTTEWQFHKDGTPNIRRITLPNGSEIIFLFHEMEAMAFESIDGYCLVVYDEPPPRHIFIGLLRGGRAKGYNTKHLFAGTPVGPNASWIRIELLERWKNGDKDIEVFSYSTDVNKQNLDWTQVEASYRLLTEKEIAIRRHGQWSDLDGLALAHLWDEQVHIIDDIDWDSDAPCIVSIDPHPSKKHMAILLGVDRDNHLVVLKELAEKQIPRQFARTLKAWMSGYRVIDIVVDNLGSADMTGGEGFTSFIDVLRDEGVRCRPTTYDEKVDAEWVTRLQTALEIPQEPNNFGQRIPKLRVHRDCRTVISDIKNVAWAKVKNKEDYKPTLEIGNCDGLACVKYALAANLFYAKPHKMKPHYSNRPLVRGIEPRMKRKAGLARYKR